MTAGYRLIHPHDDLIRRGLTCLFGGPEVSVYARRDAAIEQHLADFENYARTAMIDASHQVLAMQNELIAGSCLWVPSPGRTGMLFSPNIRNFPDVVEPVGLCLRQCVHEAALADLTMVQMLLEPADAAGIQMANNAGLWQLATLQYMERRTPRFRGSVELPSGYQLETYTPPAHDDFIHAIEKSYVDTRDCPALTGLRSIDDVVAGHKAVGVFDPSLWFMVRDAARAPIGCLLLGYVPQRDALDLVYLGLAPEARGKGVARALMQLLLRTAVERKTTLMSLAVDAQNTPARNLYRRFGYSMVSERVAMVSRTSAQAS